MTTCSGCKELAELREKLAAEQKACNHWFTEANRDHNRLIMLLTGLEALAGEWEVRGLELESVGESEADFINAAALTSAAKRLRRTLASAGLEGKDGR